MKGVVTKYNEDKGYGFIKGDDGTNLFFHISDIKSSKEPQKGDQLEFETETGEKGLVAKKIHIIDSKNKSSFIAFGSIRIKANNIKTYGLNKYTYSIDEKIPENEREAMRETTSGAEKAFVKLFGTASAIAECGPMGLLAMFAEVKDEEPPVTRSKVVDDDYLYVTTYQNDNYQFKNKEVSFDIYKKIEEIDSCT